MREALFYALLRRGLKSDDELHFFILVYLGYNIPRHRVCPSHIAPFEFVADQFFERHKTVLGFANRNGGKTLDVAILNVLELLFKDGVDIVSAGAIRDQADRGYNYVTEIIFREPLITQMTVSSLRSKTKFLNGTELQIVTGSWHGLNSPHMVKVRLDEIELMHWSILSEGLQISISKGKWVAGDCLTSTRKFMNGTMQRLLDEAPEKGIQVMSWCIWEILEPCTRLCHGDPAYGDCPAYSRKDKEGKERPLCGGKAHNLLPGGFYKIGDFIKKVRTLDWDTWETQWLNLRPSGGSLVYGEYFRDEPPWVVPTQEAVELLERAKKERWQRVVSIDFGSNFYAGYFMHDPHTDTWYWYQEYWRSAEEVDLPLATHAKNIKQEDPLGWHPHPQVFADPSGKQAIRDLEEHGILALAANNDVYSGVNHIKRLLELRPNGLPRLRLFYRCARARRELSETYIHPLDKDGKPLRDKVLKKDDHACFVAGTLIETDQGLKAIETIKAGDKVLTRWGYKRVVAAGMTDPAATVMTLHLENGQTLTGTGNHPVWVKGKGWVRLDKLTSCDILLSCTLKLSSIMASSSGATRIHLIGQTGCITTRILDTEQRALAGFMKKSGRLNMALSLLDAIFIIKTLIHLTTTRRTWLPFLLVNIKHGTANMSALLSRRRNYEGGLRPHDLLPLLGTNLKLVVHGIAIWCTLGKLFSQHGSDPVTPAVDYTFQGPLVVTPIFAQTIVNPAPAEILELITKSANVVDVEPLSLPTNTVKCGTVPVRVLKVVHERVAVPVYNLTVEREHEYFASTVLVSNCDVARYGLLSFETIGTTRYKFKKLRGVW